MKKSIIKWILCILIPISMIICVTIVEQHILQNNEFSLKIKKGDVSYLKNVEIVGDVYRFDGKTFTLNLKNGKLNSQNIYWNHDFTPILLSPQYWDDSNNCQKESLIYQKGSKKNITRLSVQEEELLKKGINSEYMYRQVGQADFVFNEVVGNDLKPVETYTLKTRGQKKLIEVIHEEDQEKDTSSFLYVDFSKEIIKSSKCKHLFNTDIMNHTIHDMYYKDHQLYVLWTEHGGLPKLHIDVYEKDNKVFDAEIPLIKEKTFEIGDSKSNTICYDFMVVR